MSAQSIESRLSDATQQVADLTTKLSASTVTVSELTAKVAEYAGKVTAIASENAELKEKLAASQAGLASEKSRADSAVNEAMKQAANVIASQGVPGLKMAPVPEDKDQGAAPVFKKDAGKTESGREIKLTGVERTAAAFNAQLAALKKA